MANSLRLSHELANAGLDAALALANHGYIRVYDGTQPSDPEQGSGALLLAEMRFSEKAFELPALGIAAPAPIAADTDAKATGTATWFRAFKDDGVTPLFDGSAGVGSSFDLNLNTAAIVIHAQVSAVSLAFPWPKGY